MANVIHMPKLSDTMIVGRLVRWLKNEGDTLERGDMLAEVETDKATMEVENFDEGVLLKHYAKAGEEIPVGMAICAVGKAGEIAPVLEKPRTEDTSSKSVSKSPPPTPLPKSDFEQSVAAMPSDPSPSFTPSTTTTVPASTNSRIKATPVARKIAAQNNLPLPLLKGSGPGGRIRKADVLEALKQGSIGQPSLESSPLSTIAEERAIPVSSRRATIARRLVESKSQIPHFYLETEIDTAPLLELRASLNKNLAERPPEKGGIKLTLNDLILKGCAEALRRVPCANVSWQGAILQQWGHVHLAFGVAIEDGLVTPVIRDAHTKSLRQIGLEAKKLIAKARSKKLTPDEMSGSTFTVTNLGMFGISNFYGIINPPNAGILSVGATIKKPVVDAAGALVVGQRMRIGFSGDHRAIDGVVGAQFLSNLKEILETPAVMLL